MPLRGPEDEYIDDGEYEESEDESLEAAPGYIPDERILFTGPKDSETGMRPVVLEKDPSVTPPVPPARGRQVGEKALALISRVPLVGLKWLRRSSEFVVYDNQPPPSGEYAVQTLGVTTIEYDGVKQNHLLVTFKAGQITGFGVEDNYLSYEATYAAIITDEEIAIQPLLGVRNGRTVGLFVSKDVKIRFNSDTDPAITICANQCPFVIDLGLNIQSLYLTTIKANTKIKLVGW
jgi:hypothetical protein